MEIRINQLTREGKMIKLGLMLCLKNGKYPENTKELGCRADMFQRLWDEEDGNECEADENIFDIILLESTEEDIDRLELEFGKNVECKFCERYEFEIE